MHGVSLERASEVFLDPLMISVEDEEHSEEEERWATQGRDKNSVVLVIIHTFREIDADNCSIRLISARRATRREAKQYSER